MYKRQAKKWLDSEFTISALSKEDQLKELEWFIKAAEPFKGLEINVLSEGIPTHTYESTVLTKAFEEITGIKGPRRQIPYTLALAAAYANEAFSFVTGIPPKAPVAGVKLAKAKMYFNPAKAIRELHLPQTPAREALADAVAWFRMNGYVKK